MKIFFIFLTVSIFWWGENVQAAGVFSETGSNLENGQKLYRISVFLDTEGQNVNVLEGQMFYTGNDLELEKIESGGSVINLWVEEPQEKNPGKITFSGGMPGGYSGARGFLFVAVFSSKSGQLSDQTKISFRNFRAYLNDGKGTTKGMADAESILEYGTIEMEDAPVDTKAPEVFPLYVTKELDLEEGKWVVILEAQDKGQGIDHFAVLESKEKYDPVEIMGDDSVPWHVVENQNVYVLEDQNLESYVYVKATDKAGNERIATLVPSKNRKNSIFDGRSAAVALTVFLLALVVILKFYVLRKKRLKQ